MPVTVDMGSRDVTIAPAQARGVVVREGPQGIQGERGPTGVQGPPGDLTKEVADATYERKLIDTAVWRVDAGALSADGLSLLDLSGNGRDAVFGAGAAAPLVLPYDGEPYVYYPQQTWNEIAGLAGGGTPTSTVTAVLRRKWEWATDYGQQIFQLGAGVRYLLTVPAGDTVLISNWVGAPTVSIGNKPVPTKEWIRITLNCATGEALCEQSDDGTLWVTLFTASHGKPPAFDSSFIYIGGGSAAHSAPGRLYSARINFDGQDVAILDPRNVNADYTKIKNTGTAGGDWTIQRATTGFKTAVVDRPLVLFGGDPNWVTAKVPKVKHGTVLIAERVFVNDWNNRVMQLSSGVGTSGAYSYIAAATKSLVSICYTASAMDPRADASFENFGEHVFGQRLSATSFDTIIDGAVAMSDTSFPAAAELLPGGDAKLAFGPLTVMEFIGAAIFDRVLTDAEVAQASAELLGTPHYAQADPHPQYVLKSQNTRVSRPNIDDRLVETWDGSKWVATYYDTGLRDVRSLLVNGWTANIATLLRIGRKVTMVVYLDPTAATSDIFFVPPVGFEPVHLGVSAPGVGSATSVNLIEVSGQQLRSVFHTATQVYYCRIDWETAPTVPTSLPGTLISPAP